MNPFSRQAEKGLRVQRGLGNPSLAGQRTKGSEDRSNLLFINVLYRFIKVNYCF
jgi:hypothetical protein